MSRFQQIRSSSLSRALAWVLLLGLMNLCIDPPDREAPGVAEDTTFNDIESIAELVGEQWLGLTDLFPERDEPDDDGTSVKKVVDFRCTKRLPRSPGPAWSMEVTLNYPFNEHFTAQYEPEPRVPPPWA